MIFNDRIIKMTNKPPEGWPEKISVAEQTVLDVERKKYYSPLYAKYRQVKRREYDECGHFMGWEPYPVGVGEPVGYEYVGYFAAKLIDDVLNSNVMMTRIMGNRRKEEAI